MTLTDLRLTSIALTLGIASAGACAPLSPANPLEAAAMTNDTMKFPETKSLTSAPMHNRIRVSLSAPVPEVWALLGDLARMPEYSAGLERVDVVKNPSGTPAEYVCHFKPEQAGGPGIVTHPERVAWYEQNVGWASAGSDTPDVFGIRNSLHRVTLEPGPAGTTVTWTAHYNADDPGALEQYRVSLEQALQDIAERLVARFGGRLDEHYSSARKPRQT